MERMTLAEAAAAMGSSSPLGTAFDDVCIDTRKIAAGCLFFCIKGENFDGHDFAAKAIESGAVAAVCEKDCGLGDSQIIVKSTRQALLDLAGHYRRKFHIPVVGITGSVGKTTTKEMTHTVISSKFKTLKNEGNLNNEIGVPMTLFRLDSSYEAAVIEMGMSGLGEISRMTAAVRPSIAIISNIGVSHIEKLGSRENILKAKLEIRESMKPNAPLIFNGDDDMLVTVEDPSRPVIYFGIDGKCCNTRASDIETRPDGISFTVSFGGGSARVDLPVSGRHHVYNALAAISAGIVLGINAEKAAKAISGYVPSGMRQNVKEKAGIKVIEDCYNSSPASQKAALEVLRDIEANRRIAVLGDMKELGPVSEEAHRNAGRMAAQNKVDILFTFGESSKLTAEEGENAGIPVCESFTDKDELSAAVIKAVNKGDAVLFKASRAMKLEEVINALYAALD